MTRRVRSASLASTGPDDADVTVDVTAELEEVDVEEVDVVVGGSVVVVQRSHTSERQFRRTCVTWGAHGPGSHVCVRARAARVIAAAAAAVRQHCDQGV